MYKMDNNERALLLRGKVRQATKDKLNPVSVKGEPYWDWEHKEILKFIEAGDSDKQIKDKIKKKRNYYSKQDVKKEKAKVAKQVSKIEDPVEKAAEKAKISIKTKQEAGAEIEQARLEWMSELEKIEYWNNPPSVAGMKKVVLFDPKQLILTSVPADAGKQDRTGLAQGTGGLRGGGGDKFADGVGTRHDEYRISQGAISHSAGRALNPDPALMRGYHKDMEFRYRGHRFDREASTSFREKADYDYGAGAKFGYKHSTKGALIHFPVPKPDPKRPETWEPPTSDYKKRTYVSGVGKGLFKNPDSEDKVIEQDKTIKIGEDLASYLATNDNFDERDKLIDFLARRNNLGRDLIDAAVNPAFLEKLSNEVISPQLNLFGPSAFDTNPSLIVSNVPMRQANPFEWQEYKMNDQGEDLENAEWEKYSPLDKAIGGMPIYEYAFAEQGRRIGGSYGGWGNSGRTLYEWEIHKEDNGTRKKVRRVTDTVQEMDEGSQQFKYLMADWNKWRMRWDMEEKGAAMEINRYHGSTQINRTSLNPFIMGDRRMDGNYHLWADKDKIVELAKDETNWSQLSDPKNGTRYPEEIDEDPHHLYTIGTGDTTAPWKGTRLLNPFYIVIYTGLGLAYIKNKNTLQYFGKLPYVATEYGTVNFKYSETMGWQDFVRDVTGSGVFMTNPELEEVEWEKTNPYHQYRDEDEGMRLNRDKYYYINDLLNLYSNYKHDGYSLGSGNGPWSIMPQFWGASFKMWGPKMGEEKDVGNFRQFQLGINSIVLDADPYNTIHSGSKKDSFENQINQINQSKVVAVVEQYLKLKDLYKQNCEPIEVLNGTKFSGLDDNWAIASPQILKNWNMWGTHPLEKYRNIAVDWAGYRPQERITYDNNAERVMPLICIEGGFFRVGTIGTDYYAYPILFDEDMYLNWDQSEDQARRLAEVNDAGQVQGRPVNNTKRDLWKEWKPIVYFEYKNGEEGDRGIKRTRLLFDRKDGVQMGRSKDPVSIEEMKRLKEEYEDENDEKLEPNDRMDLLNNPKSDAFSLGDSGQDRLGAKMIGKTDRSMVMESTIANLNIYKLISSIEDDEPDWSRATSSMTTFDYSGKPVEGKIYHIFVNQRFEEYDTGHLKELYNSPAHYLVKFEKRPMEDQPADEWDNYFKTRNEYLTGRGVDLELYDQPAFKIPDNLITQLNKQRAPLPFWTTLETMTQFPDGAIQQDHPWDQWASIGKHWVLADKNISDLLPNQVAWLNASFLEVANKKTRDWVAGGQSGSLSNWTNFHKLHKEENWTNVDPLSKKPLVSTEWMPEGGTQINYANYLSLQWGFSNDWLLQEMFGGTLKNWLNGGELGFDGRTGTGAIKRTLYVDIPYVTGRPEFQVLVSGFIIPPKYDTGRLGIGMAGQFDADSGDHEGPVIGMVKDIKLLNSVMGGELNQLKIDDIVWGHHMNTLGIHPLILMGLGEGDDEFHMLSDPYDRNEVIKSLVEEDAYRQTGLTIQSKEQVNESFAQFQIPEEDEPVWKIVNLDGFNQGKIVIRHGNKVAQGFTHEQFKKWANNENPEVGQVVDFKNKKTPYQLHTRDYDNRYKYGFKIDEQPLNPVRLGAHFIAQQGDLTVMPYSQSASAHYRSA